MSINTLNKKNNYHIDISVTAGNRLIFLNAKIVKSYYCKRYMKIFLNKHFVYLKNLFYNMINDEIYTYFQT